MSFANIQNYKNIMIPDGAVKSNLNKLNSLNIKKYNYVFIPNNQETNSDHSSIYKKVQSILRFSYKTTVICYEVWAPISRPDWYLDISDIKDKKEELINNYISQNKKADFTNGTLALNYYRGFQISKKYAEAYLQKDTFIKRLFYFYNKNNLFILQLFGIKIHCSKSKKKKI